jgi:A/G-specific adenine glycosylase
MNEKKRQVFFTNQLLLWNQKYNTRQMPWKGEKDPYRIWLSEIILQQTRVEQGLAYYNSFITTFPTVKDLAKAPETKVFKLWEGLGYYTRCKNLIATAKYISTALKGKFPDKYDDILALKGVGPYTAAAIGSFAFNIPKAVVDGNVFRVLSRYFGIDTAIDSNEGKKIFLLIAEELLDKEKPGIYNQAIMDFGAVVCKPQLPLCTNCLLKKNCVAFSENKVNMLPVKEKSISKKTRWFYYLIAEHKGKQYVKMRGAKDIWENLYEFILIEDTAPVTTDNLLSSQKVKTLFGKEKLTIISVSGIYKQQLTHQTICGQFIHLEIGKPVTITGYELLTKDKIYRLPFPKFINQYLQDKTVSLNLF